MHLLIEDGSPQFLRSSRALSPPDSGERGPSFRKLMILLMDSFEPFIFQLPPTKNFLSLAAILEGSCRGNSRSHANAHASSIIPCAASPWTFGSRRAHDHVNKMGGATDLWLSSWPWYYEIGWFSIDVYHRHCTTKTKHASIAKGHCPKTIALFHL